MQNKMTFSDFSHSIPITVSWGDMDALGHVNNTKFFRYFEDVRVSWFVEKNIFYNEETGLGLVLAEASCKFIRPIYYPSEIIACCAVHSVKNDRFSMDYGLFNKSDKNCLAIGESLIKAFNFKQKVKADLSKEWKIIT